MGAPVIVGIDLGTTNSLIAVCRDGKPELIPNVHGSVLTPSVVGLDDAGELIVGQSAKERLLTHPEQTISCAKRYMGTSRRLRVGSHEFRPEEVSAFVLRALKADAEAYLGEPVCEAIITVPAYFNEVQRKATKHAGELAGLVVERLLNEPTAASLAYGIQRDEEQQFLVFDLGGGTFDVSILEVFDGVLEVRASTGDNHLGGEDFTALLMDRLARACVDSDEASHKDFVTKHAARLYAAAESIKQSLSHAQHAELELALPDGPQGLSMRRETFEETAKGLLDRIRDPIRRALRDSKIRPADLDAVVLVGGATRMPMIHRLVTTLFGRFPETELDPDHVVALGAAVQGALKARDAALDEVLMTDVCPYTLGVEVVRRTGPDKLRDGVFSPIIQRNTTVPVSREEQYFTCHDGQRQMDIRIFQGESIDVADNVLLAEATITVPVGPAGAQGATIRFSYDVNGLLEVDIVASDASTRKTLVIKGNDSNLSEKEVQASLARLQALKVHPRESEVNLALIYRAKRLYELLLDETRQAVADALADFEGVLETQDENRIRQARRELSEFLDTLGE